MNAKMMAKWDNLPEVDHIIVGYEKPKKHKEKFAIFIRDKDEPIETRNRIEITKSYRIVEGAYEVWSQGKSSLAKTLSIVAVSDFFEHIL